MKIAVLGHGVEGQSVERYFRGRGDEVVVFEEILGRKKLKSFPSEQYDMVFRSPSVRPVQKWNSVTKYFFEHCPAKIIGVSGTKGKGTTCTMIRDILTEMGHKVHLVGNIGVPALDVLDEVKPEDVVVYEMSSFQLWDMERSPEVAVLLRLEEDHLDVHKDFWEYLAAKENLVRFQKTKDVCVFFADCVRARLAVDKTKAKRFWYDSMRMGVLTKSGEYDTIEGWEDISAVLNELVVPGEHNRENARAAILAVAGYLGEDVVEMVKKNQEKLKRVMRNFKALPHHIELVRELRGVKYYDDSYSTALPSLAVALKTFEGKRLVLIAGGKDKGVNLRMMARRIADQPELAGVVLIGETGVKLRRYLLEAFREEDEDWEDYEGWDDEDDEDDEGWEDDFGEDWEGDSEDWDEKAQKKHEESLCEVKKEDIEIKDIEIEDIEGFEGGDEDWDEDWDEDEDENVPVVFCLSMREAVLVATEILRPSLPTVENWEDYWSGFGEWAEDEDGKGEGKFVYDEGVVLLSPAGSSFDMFDSYKQRGEIFQLCVRKLK